jgi:hypothetical protein
MIYLVCVDLNAQTLGNKCSEGIHTMQIGVFPQCMQSSMIRPLRAKLLPDCVAQRLCIEHT